MELSTNNHLHYVCAARDEVLDLLTQAQQLLNKARDISNCNGLGSIDKMFHDSMRFKASKAITSKLSANSNSASYDTKVGFIEAKREDLARFIDAPYWDTFLKQTGVLACMHTEARAKWNSQIWSCDVPALTMDNIKEVMGSLHDNRRDYLEEGVVAVFKELSHDYKSNTPVKFGKRVVIERFGGYAPFYHACQHAMSKVDDLLRILQLADGKPTHEQGMTSKAVSDAKLMDRGTATIETPYYTLKVFKKGTAHIVFKRQDLVDKLNMAIGKRFPNALPAPV